MDWSLYVLTARPDIFEENMHQKGVPFIGVTAFLEKFSEPQTFLPILFAAMAFY